MEIVQPSGTGGAGSPLTVTDGVTSVLNVTTIDFTENATVTDVGGGMVEVAVSATGGGVSGQATVDFGTAETCNSIAVTTISTPSVSSSSVITVSPAGTATSDHDPDDYQWDNISGYPANIVNGVSFDIVGVAPNGSWGNYTYNYVIA